MHCDIGKNIVLTLTNLCQKDDDTKRVSLFKLCQLSVTICDVS